MKKSFDAMENCKVLMKYFNFCSIRGQWQAIYRYFSRQQHEWTSDYGGNKFEGSLSPNIDQSFNMECAECILDGEVVGWDPEKSQVLPFGTLRSLQSRNKITVIYKIVFLRKSL